MRPPASAATAICEPSHAAGGGASHKKRPPSPELCAVCEQPANFEVSNNEVVCTCCGVVVDQQEYFAPFRLPKQACVVDAESGCSRSFFARAGSSPPTGDSPVEISGPILWAAALRRRAGAVGQAAASGVASSDPRAPNFAL
jgi:hypothetical protein